MTNTVKYEYRIAQMTIAFYPEPKVTYLIHRRRRDKFLGVFPRKWASVRHNEWVTASGCGPFKAAPSAYYPAEYESMVDAQEAIKKALDRQDKPAVLFTYFDADGNKISDEKEGTDLY